MRPQLAAIAAQQLGVFLRRQALDCGYSDREIRRLKHTGEWVMLRRGAYVERDVLRGLDDLGRHVLLVQAVILKLDEPAVASHCSASALLRLPTWGIDLGMVHVTRPVVHAGRIEAGVSHHEADVPPKQITTAQGISCTAPARTALDIGREFGYQAGVVAADAVLQRGETPEDLIRLAATIADWPNSRAAVQAAAFADPGAESPGESLSRILMAEAGLPAPRTQVEIRDGNFVARVDFLIEEYQQIVEFDGRVKYRRARHAAEPLVDDGDVVWAEKKREDRLRELGFVVTRLIWSDLFGSQRELTARRLWAAADRRTRRRAA